MERQKMKIYRYPIQITDYQELKLPVDSKILTVDVVRGEPSIYALVDPHACTERISVYIYGTGNPIGDTILNQKYIGTIQTHQGMCVWHVFVGGD
jgi:hypothetical protein